MNQIGRQGMAGTREGDRATPLLIAGCVGAGVVCATNLARGYPEVAVEYLQILLTVAAAGSLLVAAGLVGLAWRLSSVVFAVAASLRAAFGLIQLGSAWVALPGWAATSMFGAVALSSALAAVALWISAAKISVRLARATAALTVASVVLQSANFADLQLELWSDDVYWTLDAAASAAGLGFLGLLALVFVIVAAARNSEPTRIPKEWTFGGIGALACVLSLGFFFHLGATQGYAMTESDAYAGLVFLAAGLGLLGFGFVGHWRDRGGVMAWIAAAVCWLQACSILALGIFLIDSPAAVPVVMSSMVAVFAFGAVAYLSLGQRPLAPLAMTTGATWILAALLGLVSLMLYVTEAAAGRVELFQSLTLITALVAFLLAAGYQLGRPGGLR